MSISFLKHKIINTRVIIKMDEANFRGVSENRVQHIVQAFQGSLHIGNVYVYELP